MNYASEERFFGQKYDRVFKAVYLDENNFKLLEAILSECFNTKVKVLKLLLSELKVRTKHEKTKRLDCTVKLDGKKVNLEINTSNSEVTKIRNLAFFNSFYSQNAKVGKMYSNKIEFVHISLNFGESLSKPLTRNYLLHDRLHNMDYTDKYKVMEVNVDRFAKFWYDKNEEEMRKHPLLISLSLGKEDLKDFKNYINDGNITEVVNKVMKLNEDPEFVYDLTEEEEAMVMYNSEMAEATENGIKIGLNEGKEEGKKEEKQSIAQKMLVDGMPIEKISQFTGLTIEEIHKLKQN